MGFSIKRQQVVFAGGIKRNVFFQHQICMLCPKPAGVMVMLEAEHMCMTMRGIRKPGSQTVTFAARGVFQQDRYLQEQFFQMVR